MVFFKHLFEDPYIRRQELKEGSWENVRKKRKKKIKVKRIYFKECGQYNVLVIKIFETDKTVLYLLKQLPVILLKSQDLLI